MIESEAIWCCRGPALEAVSTAVGRPYAAGDAGRSGFERKINMQMEIQFGQGKRIDAVFNGFRVNTDQSVKQGGGGSAPTPYEYFLSSLGTCAGIFVYSFCQSRKIPTDGLKMNLTFAFNPKEHIVEQVNVHVDTPSDFPEKYQAAIIRAIDQCAVKKSLSMPPQFNIDVG